MEKKDYLGFTTAVTESIDGTSSSYEVMGQVFVIPFTVLGDIVMMPVRLVNNTIVSFRNNSVKKEKNSKTK